MSGFPILDLVVGIIFIYFLLSIISSSAVELILTGLQARSKVLGEWLTTIFDKKIKKRNGEEVTLGQAIMDHCATTALAKSGKAPSYIDAKNFTSALLEKITYDPQNPKSIAKDMNDVIAALQKTDALGDEMQRALLGYAYEAEETYAALDKKVISKIEYFRSKVENWYDTNMDRLTGTLKKRYARPFTLLVAAITAIVLNADSIAIAKYLYSNPEARVRLATQAYQAASDTTYLVRLRQMHLTSNDSTASLEQIDTSIRSGLQNIKEAKAALASAIPLGWQNWHGQEPLQFGDVLSKIAGLLATILAIFMGAPFWFDILNKIANLRGSGPKPASSTNEDDDKKK